MKKLFIALLFCLPIMAQADDGHTLWLNAGNANTAQSAAACTVTTNVKKPSATLQVALGELKQYCHLAEVQLQLQSETATAAAETTANNDSVAPKLSQKASAEGYRLQIVRKETAAGASCNNGACASEAWADYAATITARTDIGLLYGAYALLRSQQTTAPHALDVTEQPAFGLRMLNHWDNLDGSVERGYAGRSIWKWDEMQGGRLSDSQRERLTIYARANASVGINGTVLNNVNTQPQVLSAPFLQKVKTVADLLRPYGVRVFLAVNFGSPKALGELPTADPLDPRVQRWWQRKVKEIYRLVPDFGGFLVKASSEGQPGPNDYGRTHADGANMLAAALQPYGGTVVWRSFVYGANHKGEDRVMQAVSEFKPLDGQFAPNVILQSKNGPLDFQPREPYAPIFDQIKHTPQMAELQITQEYLGQSKHLVYLATMWKDFFFAVSPKSLVGVAGVANTGDDVNWCGHPFSQANWYAFGRLAWNPDLTAEDVSEEWLRQTFQGSADTAAVVSRSADFETFVSQSKYIMMDSREACVNYMMPLGLHHIFQFDHHMGPDPAGFKPEYPIEWCPVYYHKADSAGIGFDRTVATGSGATAQYEDIASRIYENILFCPDNLLLWFHHVPWTHRMQSGRTLIDELGVKYAEGVAAVERYRMLWHSPVMRSAIDGERWAHVSRLLDFQLQDARLWQTTCMTYFRSFCKDN